MGNLEEDEILLDEKLCRKSSEKDELKSIATVRFNQNINFAYYMAYKFSEPIDPAVDKDDIFQEALTGLWVACLNYDETKGFKFTTYAGSIISGYILKMLRKSSAFKIPRITKDIMSTIIKHGYQFPLTDEEIEILVMEGKFTRKQLLDYQELELVYIDKIFDDNDSRLLDNLIDNKTSVGINLSKSDMDFIVEKILDYMKPSVRDLLREWLYRALSGEKSLQTNLGIKYGMTRQNVNRIIRDAIIIARKHRPEIEEMLGLK